MLYYKNDWIIISLFFVVNFLLKVVPLWFLRHTRYTKEQILTTVMLFLFYSFYLFVNGKNVKSILVESYNDVKHNKIFGPMSYYIKKLW